MLESGDATITWTLHKGSDAAVEVHGVEGWTEYQPQLVFQGEELRTALIYVNRWTHIVKQILDRT